MKITHTNKITATVLATLACASFGCTRTDRNVNTVPSATAPSSGTTSGTTVAANDESTATTAPAANDTSASSTAESPAASASDTSATTTKSSKKTTHIHKVKKHHLKHDSARLNRNARPVQDQAAVKRDADRNAHIYNSHIYDNDAAVNNQAASTDVNRDNTISGTTMAAPGWRETGLSPFAQEPASRIPTQIGSGQITGEDRSTTVLDHPGLFQDEAAFNRDQIR